MAALSQPGLNGGLIDGQAAGLQLDEGDVQDVMRGVCLCVSR